MPTGFVRALRRYRRPIVMIAVALAMLQSVVAGLGVAQAAAVLAASPFDAAICHGAGGTAPADGSAPPERQLNACCAICMAASPVVVLFRPAIAGRSEVVQAGGAVGFRDPATSIAWRAVRAGASQAPPSLA